MCMRFTPRRSSFILTTFLSCACGCSSPDLQSPHLDWDPFYTAAALDVGKGSELSAQLDNHLYARIRSDWFWPLLGAITAFGGSADDAIIVEWVYAGGSVVDHQFAILVKCGGRYWCGCTKLLTKAALFQEFNEGGDEKPFWGWLTETSRAEALFKWISDWNMVEIRPTGEVGALRELWAIHVFHRNPQKSTSFLVGEQGEWVDNDIVSGRKPISSVDISVFSTRIFQDANTTTDELVLREARALRSGVLSVVNENRSRR